MTSFYGPEKPQYEEMVSIIQGDGGYLELMDENMVNQIDKIQANSPSPYLEADDNTGGGGS